MTNNLFLPVASLLNVPSGVECHKSEGERNGNQHDGGKNFHDYNSSNEAMWRSIRRCTLKPDRVMITTVATAPKTLCVGAEPGLEISQPTKLMSVTTIMPSQNLR